MIDLDVILVFVGVTLWLMNNEIPMNPIYKHQGITHATSEKSIDPGSP